MLGALRGVARYRLRGRPPAPLPERPRILAVQPDNLGGMLLTTPALRLLKEGLPECELTVMAGPWAADVAAHCPSVDRVEVCPFPGFARDRTAERGIGRLTRVVAPWRLLAERAAGVSGEGYHLAIVFHADFYWGAALAAVAGIPHRLGYATADAAPFLSRALPAPARPVGVRARRAPGPHVAELGLALAEEALSLAGREGPPGFDARALYEPTPQERDEGARLWRAHGLDGGAPVVAIHPAPGAPAKRWAPERFAIVGDHFAGRYGARVLITGGPGDVDEARAVAAASHHRPVELAGQTSFGALAVLLERCRFVVGTDNGALHLATTRGVPSLRIFGPVDPGAWGGWEGRAPADPLSLAVASQRPCAPCHRLDLPGWEVASGTAEPAYPCMAEVSAERVIAAAERLWAATAGAGVSAR